MLDLVGNVDFKGFGLESAGVADGLHGNSQETDGGPKNVVVLIGENNDKQTLTTSFVGGTSDDALSRPRQKHDFFVRLNSLIGILAAELLQGVELLLDRGRRNSGLIRKAEATHPGEPAHRQLDRLRIEEEKKCPQ